MQGRRNVRVAAITRCLVLATALLLGQMTAECAHASGMYPLELGELPRLAANEGLLLVSIDSEFPLEAVYMKQESAVLNSRVLKNPPAGRTTALVRVAAGRYGWDKLRIGNWARSWAWWDYRLGDDPESFFDVRAGVVNYPGDLVVKRISAGRSYIQRMDHALLAIDWLESNYPGLLKQRPLVYSGPYADPFPAYYLKARNESNAGDSVSGKLLAPPDPGELPLSPKTLWQRESLESIALNPVGDLLATQVRVDAKASWAVDLVDLETGESHRVARTDIPFESLSWSGDRNLLLAMDASKLLILGAKQHDSDQVIHVVRVGTGANGKRTYAASQLPHRGRILDVLENDPDHLLFATKGIRNNLLVHRLDISSEKAIARFDPETMPAVNKLDKGEYWWFADGAGELAVALAWRDGKNVFSRRSGRKLEEFLALDVGSNFDPVALSDDGNTLYAITDDARKQRELVAFDIPTRKIAKTLFSKESVDVVSAIFGDGNHPIGVRYYEAGRLISDYFGATDRKRVQSLQKAFPGKSVVVIDKNANSSKLILYVDGSDSAPKYYQFDTNTGRAALIMDATPWLNDVHFAPTRIVNVTSKDGLQIEAYLTIPEGTQKRPLIVMPHGGPVGISDHLRFDRDTQFLASLGYAVLRVNYRGSDGFGKSFREAGYQQFGSAIEDDIDAALARVLADHEIDATRMCVLGFSYGGYSALISAVRWPDRFRCAISVSGVADRLLQYTASDSGRTAEQRKTLEKWWGDPVADGETFLAASPVYRHRDIKLPVMLVHGNDDIRVDPEQTRRMQRMLELDGRPPVGILFEAEGHGIESLVDLDTLWRGIAGFLHEHLDSSSAPPSAAAPTKP
jgi:dienelactone hydrolase